MIYGISNYFKNNWRNWTGSGGTETTGMSMFPALLISNTVLIIALISMVPVFSAMKSSYLLNSLPAFATFLGLGVMPHEHNITFKRAVIVVFTLLFSLVSLHIFHIFLSMP
jgi:hypothetical protein